MQNLGNKLSEVQTQVSGWMGNMRRSLQEAVEFVSGTLERERTVEEDEERLGTLGRAISPLRSFASRGRQSLRNLSQQSRQRFSLRRRASTSNTTRTELKDCDEDEDEEQDPFDGIREADETKNSNDDPGAENRLNQVLQRLTSQVSRRSIDSDTPDVSEPEPILFPQPAAPLLDSSLLRSKVDLGKKRSIKRMRPSRAVRQRAALPSLTEGTNLDWRFCDSTDAKAPSSNGQDSESEEETSKDATPTPSQPKRVPLFPGVDQSALMAQLKRRSVRMEAEATDDQTSPVVSARSPRTPTRSLGPRVLPPVDSKDGGGGASPSWLLELKSKKRLSQPESDV